MDDPYNENRRSGLQSLTGITMAFFIIMFTIQSCRKDFDFSKVKDLSWNPDFALPLVHDSLTLKDALTQTGTEDHFYIDENGEISILYYYNNNAFRVRPNDLIRITPVEFSYSHPVTAEEQAALGTGDLIIPPVPFTFNLTGGSADIRVDKLLVKNGAIRVTTQHTFANDGYLTIRILNATKNGAPFTFPIGPFVSGPAETIIDIAGVLLDLSSAPNIVQAEVEGFLRKSTRPVSGDHIAADFQVAIDTIGRFEGFLGHQTLPQLDDTVRVDVFNNAFALGEVYFVDPQASVTIVNSIGIPADVTIEKLVAINNASGNAMDIAGNLGAGAFFSVPSPLITATKPTVTPMYYNNANTGNSMNDFFNLKPDNVAFQIKAVINPSGTPVNFFSDTSSFYGDLRVKLPLYGHFDNLTLQDTFDLTISKPEELEHLAFRTYIVNGLPMNTRMQVYFTDEFYNKTDSLTGKDNIMINEAPVDPATHLPYPGQYGTKDTTFILTADRMHNLANVKKVLVKAVLHTSDNGQVNVKLRADQLLRLTFTARAKLKIPLEINN
ncbi:MAG: hypothetical protein WCJ26_01455 [bacterium]